MTGAPVASDQGPGLELPALQVIVDHIAEPLFIKDRGFHFVLLNRAFCQLVGYPREQMLGKTDYDFFPKPESDFFRRKDEEVFATGNTVTIEAESITDARGSQHVLSTRKVPFKDASGKVTHLIGVFHDITRLKAAEDALRRANEELERRVRERTSALEAAQDDLVRKEKLAVLGQIAGGIAHQIRNPLATIKNAAYVLERHLPATSRPELASTMQILHEEVNRANRIITGLLDYARMRAPERAPAEIGPMLEHVLAAAQVPENIRVEIEITTARRVLVDEGQVEGAVFNLVRNCVEEMPHGGKLTLDARDEGDVVVLGIVDTGPGVAPGAAAHLFEPLYTTKALGLGLGLVTARTLVEGQGGTIACASSGAEGTRFEIRLPAARL